MLPHAILIAILVCLRAGSAIPQCQFQKDQHYKNMVGGLVYGMDEVLFTTGKTVDSKIIRLPRPDTDDTFKTGICFGKHMKNVIADYNTPQITASACPVLSAEMTENETAWCKAKKMTAKAQVKLTPISFSNCKMDRKTTESETKVKKYEIHGDLKISGSLFKALDIEASVGGSMETTRTYQVSTEEICKAGQSATYASVAIILTTTIGEIAVSGRDEKGICREDMYKTTTPFKNTYLVKENSGWLDCNATDSTTTTNTKRDLEDYPDEDACYSLDPSTYLHPEPCYV